MSEGVFITGTDTGVGKTHAACALLHAFRERGVPAMPMKPVAAGAVQIGGRPMSEDTAALLAAAGLDASWAATVTPFLFTEPIAPHVAAAREGRVIRLEPVLEARDRLALGGRFVVAEGVGGFRVPLSATLDTVDLARALALPVVLVVGMRLGCLNHALLTRDAIAASGLPLAGWIANAIDPAMAAREESEAALRERLGAPLLGTLPHGETAAQAAPRLRLDLLRP